MIIAFPTGLSICAYDQLFLSPLGGLQTPAYSWEKDKPWLHDVDDKS